MFAVVRCGGRQYKVGEGDVIFVDRLPMEAGQEVILDEVLMVGEKGVSSVGSPLVSGAAVTAKVLEQARSSKIIVFKKKRRKNYRRKLGHRQDLTVLRITGIAGEGGKKLTSAAKAVAKKTAPKTEATKKPAAKKTAPKVEAAKKPAAKTAAPKAKAAKKPTAKKTLPKAKAAKKSTGEKAPAKKAAPKRASTDKKAAGKPGAKPAAKSKK